MEELNPAIWSNSNTQKLINRLIYDFIIAVCGGEFIEIYFY